MLLKSIRSMSFSEGVQHVPQSTGGQPLAYVTEGLATNAEALGQEGPYSFAINALRPQLCT